MIDGLVRLMASDHSAPINLGNPDECTMLELADKIRALTGAESTIELRSLPTDDPARRRPDISSAIEVLGWRPGVLIDEGLRRTIADFRRRIEGGQST